MFLLDWDLFDILTDEEKEMLCRIMGKPDVCLDELNTKFSEDK